jgi:hypothetical protein
MLPGFRFLFAAIVLSTSVLVFGLGAAALLRAAHEQFASRPTWRAAPEPKFAQQNEAPKEISGEILRETLVLAMLRVEPEPVSQKSPESVPAAAAPAELPAIVAVPDQPDQIAVLKPQDKTPPEAVKPEIPAAEPSVQIEPPVAGTPAPDEATRIATAEQVLSPANETVAPALEQALAADALIAWTKIATLGGPPVAVETQPPAKTAGAKPDRGAIKKRLQARRAAERRRIEVRARQAAQPPAADPFAQPTITTRSR